MHLGAEMCTMISAFSATCLCKIVHYCTTVLLLLLLASAMPAEAAAAAVHSLAAGVRKCIIMHRNRRFLGEGGENHQVSIKFSWQLNLVPF